MKYFVITIIILLLCSCEFTINKDHVAEGTRLMQQGDFFNAALEFDDALFIDENNLNALRGKFMCAFNMGITDKALDAANKFIELKPDSAVGYSDRGIVYSMKKDYEKALADFNKVIETEKANPLIAFFNKAEALRELNRDQEAIQCYRIVTTNDKNDARAYLKMGKSYLKLRMYDSACAAYKTAVDLGDQDAKTEFETNCK